MAGLLFFSPLLSFLGKIRFQRIVNRETVATLCIPFFIYNKQTEREIQLHKDTKTERTYFQPQWYNL